MIAARCGVHLTQRPARERAQKKTLGTHLVAEELDVAWMSPGSPPAPGTRQRTARRAWWRTRTSTRAARPGVRSDSK